MSQVPAPEPSAWASLLAVPAIVARQLRAEPLLLTSFGAAVLLTVLALFGPADASLYAWLLAGLTLVLGVAWAVLKRGSSRPGPSGRSSSSGRSSADPAAPESPGSNAVDVGHRADFGTVDMRAAARNSITGGRRTRIQSLTMRAGVPEPTERHPAVGQPDEPSPGVPPSDETPPAGRR